MQFNKFIVLTTLLSILTTHILLADAYDSISTSRPGAANPTSSVPFGLYQFEMGTNLSTSPGADTIITIDNARSINISLLNIIFKFII